MTDRRRTALFLLVLSYLGFVSLGLPDGLLGVAWPSMRASFGLPLDALGALLITSTSGYVLSSFASGRMLARMSIGTLLAISCLATAASLLGYSVAPAWAVVVTLGVLAGLGAGAIDAGINTHVAKHHSARMLNLLHAFYGLGTTSGPILMTSVLAAGLPWQRGYALVGGAQLVLAVCFFATRRLWRSDGDAAPPLASASVLATLRLSAARLGVLTFFCYVGIEAAAGAWIYTLLKEGRGMSMTAAGATVSVFWGGLMGGRLLAAVSPLGARPQMLLRVCTLATCLSALALTAGAGPFVDVIAAAMLGCACGPIFPSLIATTPRRLGTTHAANAIGFQIAGAAVGQSLLPATIGMLAHEYGLGAIAHSLAGLSLTLAILYRILDRIPLLLEPMTQRATAHEMRQAAALANRRACGVETQ